MERFYVIEPGAYLRKSGNYLVIVKGQEVIGEIPLQGLQQLTLVGYSSMSGAVLDALIRHRVETVLLSPRGQYRARLMVDEHKHVQRRQAQYLHLQDPASVLETAKAIVRGKLRNAARFLTVRGNQYSESQLNGAASQIKGLASFVDRQTDLELVRGLEGSGANLYFGAFPMLIRVSGFEFRGRNRRPPLDPVNALLSFIYTLLTQEVLTAVKIAGLDPYLGALHAVDYGRPSLACDLVEEWRTFLGDRLVLALINRRVVGPDDFVYRSVPHTDAVDEEDLKRKRPVEMKPKTLRAFLESYERWMATSITEPQTRWKTDYRGLIRRQVQQFRRYLIGEQDAYEPFLWSRVY
jgi:CRISPR-associated protein Cas1